MMKPTQRQAQLESDTGMEPEPQQSSHKGPSLDVLRVLQDMTPLNPDEMEVLALATYSRK